MLPLLKAEVVSTGWINSDTLPADCGAAQAAPEPLFIVRHISRRDRPSPAWRRWSGDALVGILLPGLLLLIGTLPFWGDFRRYSLAQAVLHGGTSAAVVGTPEAALYNGFRLRATRRLAHATTGGRAPDKRGRSLSFEIFGHRQLLLAMAATLILPRH